MLTCVWVDSWFLSLSLKANKKDSVFQKVSHQSVLILINMDYQQKVPQLACFLMKNTEIATCLQLCFGQADFMEQQVSQEADQV